jgi:hypothetical protein
VGWIVLVYKIEEATQGHPYKNMITIPAARILRVVLDQPASAVLFTYSHASSILDSLAAEDIVAEK